MRWVVSQPVFNNIDLSKPNKMKNATAFSVFFLITVCLPQTLLSQDWQWQWGKYLNHIPERQTWSIPLHVDFMNNMYTSTLFDSLLVFADTSFYNPNNGHGTYKNLAISKINSKGEILKVLKLQTSRQGLISQQAQLRTDSQSNIYLSLPFRDTLLINNTIITGSFEPVHYPPVLLVAKFDHDFNLLWHGLIESPNQEYIDGLAVSADDNLILCARHYAIIDSVQAVYLGQDTTKPFNLPISSICKIGPDGDLLWRTEIRSNQHFDGNSLSVDEDGLIHYFGRIRGDLYIGTDTIYNPEGSSSPSGCPVFLSFDQNGNLVDSFLFSCGIYIWHATLNSEGDIFFLTGPVADTVFLGNDTIAIPVGEQRLIVGRLDQQQFPVWYEVIKSNYGIWEFYVEDDYLFFATTNVQSFTIADTTLSWGGGTNTVVVEINPEGTVSGIKPTESVFFLSGRVILDNCGNLLMTGEHRRYAIFGDDTLFAQSWTHNESFIASLERKKLPQINLGTDTIVCGEYVIQGPQGYEFYIWNGIQTDQPEYKINETGLYQLSCASHNGCWHEASIFVEVHPTIEINLGADTTLWHTDTLNLSLSGNYDQYLWSDGTTSNTLTIVGTDFEDGQYPIWVQVIQGPCMASDTLYLTIESDAGLADFNNLILNIRPNPFYEYVLLDLKRDSYQVEIYNLAGIRLYSREIHDTDKETIKINKQYLPNGVYLLKLLAKEQVYSAKLIKYAF